MALEYDFAKNPIIMMDDIYNIEKQQTILTYHNFPEKKNLIANISWYRRFGFYTLFLDATYDQNWSKTPFGDGYLSLHKPCLVCAFNRRRKLQNVQNSTLPSTTKPPMTLCIRTTANLITWISIWLWLFSATTEYSYFLLQYILH